MKMWIARTIEKLTPQLRNKTKAQFHQHFTYKFFVRTLFQQLFYINVTRKSCRNDIHMKNLCVKCWWNWHQYFDRIWRCNYETIKWVLFRSNLRWSATTTTSMLIQCILNEPTKNNHLLFTNMFFSIIFFGYFALISPILESNLVPKHTQLVFNAYQSITSIHVTALFCVYITIW
jgi:hypothetical protein